MAVNPNGEMVYFDGGFPFSGIRKTGNDAGEMQFWDSGFPMTYIFPPAAATSNIKTINGTAIASVKTVSGLALASVKTFNGVTNV